MSAEWIGGVTLMAAGALLCFVIVMVVLIARGVWHRTRDGHVLGRVAGFRCEFESARVDVDNIVRRVWVVPVVFTNESRRAGKLPEMFAIATVTTNRRTPVLRRPYVHNGVFQWEAEEAPNGVMFNPSGSIAARVTVELPVDEFPVRVTFATLVNNARGRGYTGRVSMMETVPGPASADVA